MNNNILQQIYQYIKGDVLKYFQQSEYIQSYGFYLSAWILLDSNVSIANENKKNKIQAKQKSLQLIISQLFDSLENNKKPIEPLQN
jgi:hypothetical protein